MRVSWCALAVALAISAPLVAAERAERLPDADPQALVQAAEEQAASEENVVRVSHCFYVVTKGDTIEGVADYFGIPVSLIQTYNDWVGVVRKFEVGMKIHIPAVKEGRQPRCVSEERATKAQADLEEKDQKESSAGERVVGEELRAAQKLRKEVEGDLVRYNLQARKQAHEHCSECAQERKEERQKLRQMRAADQRRKQGRKLEAEAEADFKHREASQKAQAASLPKCMYTARGEDTFGSVAELFGVVPRLLREGNDLAPEVSGWFDKPAAGRRLRIPAPRSRARAYCDMEAVLCPYVVRTGDSLGFIADKLGASRLHIALVNQLPSSEFAYYPAAQKVLKIPNPSQEGADNCREVPHKESVPALRLPRAPRRSKEADVMPPHKRSSEAGRVAARTEQAADRAEAASEAAMKRAKQDRERASATKEALEAAQKGKADAQRAYRAAHEAGNKAAMREALDREDRLTREAAAKRQRAAAAKEEAKRTTAQAQEASAQWQAKSVQAEQAASVAEAHEDLESAADGQSMDQHGSTGATGAADLDFSGHVEAPANEVGRAKQAVQESAEVQLKHTREELARVRAHAMAAQSGSLADSVPTAAALVEVARRRRAGGDQGGRARAVDAEEKAVDANTKHQRELDSQLEGFLHRDAEDAESGDGDEDEREAELEEDLEGAREEIASLRREVKSADEQRDEARGEAEKARDEARAAQQRAATAVAGEQEAFEERDEAREKALQSREEADELEAQLSREEEEENKAVKELEGTQDGAKSAQARAKKLRRDLARATERARSLTKRVEKLSTKLSAERARRVRLGGKLVRMHHELVEAHQEAVDANERSDRLTRERDAAERRLRTVVEAQQRAERQVREEQARAKARKADEKAALKEAKAQQTEARRAAAAVVPDGASHRDPCTRATAAQSQAHELSLEIRVTNATVYKDRVELDRLQASIEKLDDRAESLRDRVAARLRKLQNEVGLREAEMRAYHSTASDHDAALDSARDMRGLLLSSRMGLTNGELRAYAGDAAWEAHQQREERDAVEHVEQQARRGALPATWVGKDGHLKPAFRKEAIRAVADGQGSSGSPQAEAKAEAEAEATGDRIKANAVAQRREERGSAAALLEEGGSQAGSAKSPAQRSVVRRLREYLNSIVHSAKASHAGLETAETRHHTEFVDKAEKLRHVIDQDRLELGRVQRERSRLQTQREAYQDHLMRSVAALEDMHRRYKDATHMVLVGLEKCNGSSSSLRRGEVTLTDGN